MLAEVSLASRGEMKLLRTLAEVFLGKGSISAFDGGRLREEGRKPVLAELEDLLVTGAISNLQAVRAVWKSWMNKDPRQV